MIRATLLLWVHSCSRMSQLKCMYHTLESGVKNYYFFTFNTIIVGAISLPRTCLEDVEIDGKVIPKGSFIIPHIYSAHHDTRVWQKPDEFRPERFIDKDRHIIKHKAFYPFSIGKGLKCLFTGNREWLFFVAPKNDVWRIYLPFCQIDQCL